MLKNKLNEWFLYFKKVFWIFLLVLLLANFALYYFVSWYYYLIGLIIWNVVLIWILIPIFIWIAKTYLISESMEIYEEAKEELVEQTEKYLENNKKNV